MRKRARVHLLGLAAIAAIAAALPVSGGSAQGGGSGCSGETPTIVGTGGPDTLTGTARRDVIAAGPGDDVVNGVGGGDLLCGEDGNDRLDGGDSFDTVVGGPGNDLVRGGVADDVLVGSEGNDQLDGGAGYDSLQGDADTDGCYNGERRLGCEQSGGAVDTALPVAPPTAVPCDYFASSSGDDGNPGSFDRPYRTAERLVNTLKPGETGCLQAGDVFEEADDEILVRSHGERGNPITVQTTPGGSGRAKIRGRIWICKDSEKVKCTPGAQAAEYGHDVVFQKLVLDGLNDLNTRQGFGSERPVGLPSPTVNGDRITFRDNVVTNQQSATCFALGSVNGYGAAEDVVLFNNVINKCGRRRVPTPNSFDHGINLESSRRAVIANNVIFDNSDRGILLYPDAQDTRIVDNLIERNGRAITFGGETAAHSSGTLVTNNVIANSRLDYEDESNWQVMGVNDDGYFPDEPPWANRVESNCFLHPDPSRNIQPAPHPTFTEANNVFASLRSDCADFGPRQLTDPGLEPEPGVSVEAVRRSGTVKVKEAGTRATEPLPLLADAEIPLGSDFDTTRGRVGLETAPVRDGGGMRAIVYDGRFVARQRSATTGLHIELDSDHLRANRSASAAHRRKRRHNHTWIKCTGCSASGCCGNGQTRGTTFFIEDRCDGTYIRVKKGRVRFTDFGRKRAVTVRAGKDYFAPATRRTRLC
jgi:parallel beta-helix repeat protein